MKSKQFYSCASSAHLFYITYTRKEYWHGFASHPVLWKCCCQGCYFDQNTMTRRCQNLNYPLEVCKEELKSVELSRSSFQGPYKEYRGQSIYQDKINGFLMLILCVLWKVSCTRENTAHLSNVFLYYFEKVIMIDIF